MARFLKADSPLFDKPSQAIECHVSRFELLRDGGDRASRPAIPSAGHGVRSIWDGMFRVDWALSQYCAGPGLCSACSGLFGDQVRTLVELHPNERVALFIDGADFFATVRSLGFDVDFKRLASFFREQAILVRALYYTAIVEDQQSSSIRPLVDWLDYNGYAVTAKRAKQFTDDFGRRKIKRNIAIELAVDVLRLAPRLDHVVIFSGDGDFVALVENLQQNGKRVSIVSTMKSDQSKVSNELRRQADQFVDLVDLENAICRKGKH